MFEKIFLLILLLNIVLSAQQPDSAIPENQLGKIVQEFIFSVNSKDSNQVSKFINERMSNTLMNTGPYSWTPNKYKKMLLNLQNQIDDLSIMNVMKVDSNEYIGIFVKSADTLFAGIEFWKSRNENKLRGMEIHKISHPSKPYEWSNGLDDEKDIVEAVEEKLNADYEKDKFSGIILIAKGDTIIFQNGYGNADKLNKIFNSKDIRYHTGSIGKMFTAVAVGQLVEKNLIDFHDTLGNLLKNYPNPDAASKITVHHLLTHSSGIADPFESGRRIAGEDYSTARKNFPLFADLPLKFEPGEKHSYSNGNYAVLAAIVEEVNGISFEQYLNEFIFKPAGMSIVNKESYKNIPRAIGYTNDPVNDPMALNEKTPSIIFSYEPDFEYSGFSNLFLTAEDIYKFLYSFKNGKLVSASMADTLSSGKIAVDPNAPVKYGYGFYDAYMWGVNLRGHSGGGSRSGIGADAEIIWNNDYYLVALGNYDLSAIRPISLSIARFLGTL